MVWLHAPPPSSSSASSPASPASPASSSGASSASSTSSSASASASSGPPPALALLAGDEIYHPDNLRQRRPTGVSVNASVSAAVLDYIRAAQAAGTPVFACHVTNPNPYPRAHPHPQPWPFPDPYPCP